MSEKDNSAIFFKVLLSYNFLKWGLGEFEIMPMLYNESFNNRTMSSELFSLKEADDTLISLPNNGAFSLII